MTKRTVSLIWTVSGCLFIFSGALIAGANHIEKHLPIAMMNVSVGCLFLLIGIVLKLDNKRPTPQQQDIDSGTDNEA